MNAVDYAKANLSGEHAYLIGKGKSLDNLTRDWFQDRDAVIWCLNQSFDVVSGLGLPNRMVCVQSDGWINYRPGPGAAWLCADRVDCRGAVPAGTYNIERLTGHWGSPTCLCALRLLKEAGTRSVTMIGFDSFFDNSRTYASCLGVESDQIAPMEMYNAEMRGFAKRNGIGLTWVDRNGTGHRDGLEFTKCLLCVAHGGDYARQAREMAASFVRHNKGWDVAEVFNSSLTSILPPDCRTWSPFNQCEIGRWIAMGEELRRHDTVLYCDGDIRWYAEYPETERHALTLCPHQVSMEGKFAARHFLHKDGVANLGIIRMDRSMYTGTLLDYVVNEARHNPAAFMHGDKLWLQNLATSASMCGMDVAWDNDPGMDVAVWNLRCNDRSVVKDGGRYMVSCLGEKAPLRAFHFSGKSLASLPKFGAVVAELHDAYVKSR